MRARRRDSRDAAPLGRDYADLLSPLLNVTGEDLRRGLSLFERVDRLGAFDAVLAASAAAAGASALVSAGAAFAGLPELRHLIPDAAGVARFSPRRAAREDDNGRGSRRATTPD